MSPVWGLAAERGREEDASGPELPTVGMVCGGETFEEGETWGSAAKFGGAEVAPGEEAVVAGGDDSRRGPAAAYRLEF